jgi:uncharacterized protein involved in exopolysaccharide biosynthesis
MSTHLESSAAPAMLPAAYATAGLSLQQIWSILYAYRRIIGIAVVAAVLLSAIISLVMPKTYIATALVQVDAPTRDAESGNPLPGELAAGYVTTQVDLIGSPAVLMSAVDRLGWADDPAYTKSVPTDAPGGARAWLMEERLFKNLKVSGGTKDSRLIAVSYSGRSADEAAKAANAVANAYVETLTQSFTGSDSERAKTYTGQLDELRKNVDAAQAKLTEFRERTGVIDIEQRGSLDIEQERLLDLERRLVAAESDEQLATLRAQQSAKNAGADINVLTSASVQALKAAESNLVQRLAQISGTLGPRHPEYRAAEAELEAVRSRLSRETGVYSESLRAQAATSAGDAAALRKARDAQRARVLELRGQQDEGASLLRAVESAKLIYDEALKSYDQVVLSQARRSANATIVAAALPPLRKSKPKTSVNLLIGLFGGLVCSALGCLLWELLHRRIRCVDDIAQVLGEPPMAVFGAPQ